MSEMLARTLEGYLRFWKVAFQRAFSKAWIRIGGAFTIIVPVSIGALLSLQAQPFESIGELVGREEMRPYIAFLFVAAIFWLLLITNEPVRIDTEKQNEIKALKAELLNQHELALPKLEITYNDSIETSRQHWGKKLYTFRITARNSGNTQVSNLCVKILETKPSTYPFFPIELGLTHDVKDRLNPHDSIFADLLQTHDEGVSLFFCARDKALQYPCPVQRYEILVSASGDNSPATQKWFEFLVDTGDALMPYRIRELNSDGEYRGMLGAVSESAFSL